MISSLWIAKTGLDAQQTNMDVIANNLANVSTNGFKRQRAVFEDLLYQTIRQPGAQSSEQTTLPSGLQIGTGVRPVATERLHSQGNLSQTNNSKDVAIKGQGFFQVMLPDGTSAYTRDGSFQVDQNGQLVTAGGFQVQPAITIPANSLSITIGRDGIVSVTQQGQAAPVQVGQLNLTTFMNDTGLESIGENLYTETQSSGTPNESTPGLNGAGLLESGFPVCRYEDDAGLARDVLAGRDFAWAVHQYDGGHGLSHRVRAYALNAAGIPERIEISRHAFPRYGLKLTLLQAERLSADDPRLRP